MAKNTNNEIDEKTSNCARHRRLGPQSNSSISNFGTLGRPMRHDILRHACLLKRRHDFFPHLEIENEIVIQTWQPLTTLTTKNNNRCQLDSFVNGDQVIFSAEFTISPAGKLVWLGFLLLLALRVLMIGRRVWNSP